MYRTRTFDDDSDSERVRQEEDQRLKREKEKAWQSMMKSNLSKMPREASEGRMVATPRQVEVSGKYQPTAADEEDEEEEIGARDDEAGDEAKGVQMNSRQTVHRITTEDEAEVDIASDGKKSAMTRRSGELKIGQVLPFAPITASPIKREIVVAQHSVDFPLS